MNIGSLLEREKKSNPRRDTIRQIRRMIYPSGGRGSSTTVNSRRGPRSTIASREIPFMQFVSGKSQNNTKTEKHHFFLTLIIPRKMFLIFFLLEIQFT